MVQSVSAEAYNNDFEAHSLPPSHNLTENSKDIHKVGFPQKRRLVSEFAEALKETFFADDPLRPYKDQPRARKLVLSLQFLFPIFEWGTNYNLTKLKGDIIAGLTIASLCIPQVCITGNS